MTWLVSLFTGYWMWFYIGGLVLAGLLVWRISAWHEAYNELTSVKSQLEDERDCNPESSCVRHLEQLRIDSEKQLAEAIAEANAKQEAERAEQSKREDATKQAHQKALAQYKQQLDEASGKLVHAVASDQSCRTWYETPIACPLN